MARISSYKEEEAAVYLSGEWLKNGSGLIAWQTMLWTAVMFGKSLALKKLIG